ncbi:hypothetical protein [Endozoicomonas sp. ONNA1]|uniref:phage tail assembly chaperone n=1 Tax=Endozoicomonas sp. ONNA1 TaxID=2828740 RepID=UPI0021493D8C|nr:hypothetical protein [Endozoicomonas sp. ONNA1]
MKPVKGTKTTLKANLEQVYKTTGVKPKKLSEQPEQPTELKYLVNWFYKLFSSTSGSISYTEIRHWSDLTQVKVRAWEVEVIQQLSVIFRRG